MPDLVDVIEVPTQRKHNSSGQLIVPCAFAKVGVQEYKASQLGLYHLDSDVMVPVYREEDEVFDQESMDSFRSSPVTLGHPICDGLPVKVSPENAKDYQVGFLEGKPTREEDLLKGTLVITSKDAIDAIDDGTKQLSAGYSCDIYAKEVEGEERYFQRNIVANHIAIVDKGRAGASCSLSDDDDLDSKTQAIQDDLDSKTQAIQDELKETKAKLKKAEEAVSFVETIKKAIGVNDSSDDKITDLIDAAVNKKVDERVKVIEQAKNLKDDLDFTGNSVEEIMKKTLIACLPNLDLKDKDDVYIKTRFDILVEDGVTPHASQIGMSLKDSLNAEVLEYKNPVEEARTRMIKRNMG